MKRLAILTMGLLVGGVALAGIDGTAHDLGDDGLGTTEICVFCHTPHNASTTNWAPLWNRTDPTNSYTPYSSSTLDAADVDTTLGPQSLACMSCHDDTIALGNLINPPNGATMDTTTTLSGLVPGSNAILDTDLSNDHPVGFTYDSSLASVDGELQDPSTNTTVQGMLFGTNNDQLECASCHDVHDNTNQPFLVMSNDNSALCLTCHIK